MLFPLLKVLDGEPSYLCPPQAHEASFRRSERQDSRGHRLTLRPTYANIGMHQRMKNLTWLADSRSNVKSFPAGVQDDIGYALYAAQLGERSAKAKPLHGLGGQVMEIAAYDASGTYRAICSRRWN
jgi:hypothetical protein